MAQRQKWRLSRLPGPTQEGTGSVLPSLWLPRQGHAAATPSTRGQKKDEMKRRMIGSAKGLALGIFHLHFSPSENLPCHGNPPHSPAWATSSLVGQPKATVKGEMVGMWETGNMNLLFQISAISLCPAPPPPKPHSEWFQA